MITTTQTLKEKLHGLRQKGESFSKTRLGVGQEFVSIVQIADEDERQNSLRETQNPAKTMMHSRDTAPAQ